MQLTNMSFDDCQMFRSLSCVFIFGMSSGSMFGMCEVQLLTCIELALWLVLG